MSRSVSFVTLGCKTNQFESAAMGEQLQQAGYELIDFEQGADLVIVNTCTVTSATDSQSRNLIRRARRLNPTAEIVVTGCYAQIDPQTLAQLDGVRLVLGNQEKSELLTYLTAATGQVQVSDIRSQKSFEPLELTSFAQRSRAFVQIQNGCDAFCSYCIIPYARGTSRSVAAADVVTQVEKLQQAGYPEVVLTGIHIGRYGHDLQPRTDLCGLLRQIEQSSFSGRLRLGSVEPTELTDELFEYVVAHPWVCRHFHIPLQSGSSSVLKRMNRHYDTGFFADLLTRIRNTLPDAAIGLDVIAGFPGETEEEFRETCCLLESLPLTHLHVFPFSKRTGTPAATMPGQLSGDVIKARAAKLRQIGEEKQLAFLQRFIGRELHVIVEGGEGDDCRKALADNYLTVRVPLLAQPGKLCRVVVEAVEGLELVAHLAV